MTFPLDGSTNLGDPITDTGERRRREDDPVFADRERLQTANFLLRHDLLSAHIELRRLRALLREMRGECHDSGGMYWAPSNATLSKLFDELDAQEKSGG